jgi:hypothetical protein
MSVQKVLPLQPQWAAYPGFTLLFENPQLTRFGSWLHLDTPMECQPPLYRRLAAFSDELSDALYLRHDGFCALPSPTYHVTVWDGPNIETIQAADPAARPQFERALAGVADSLGRRDLPFLELIRESELLQVPSGPLTFECGSLLLYADTAIALIVQPTVESRPAYQQLVERRRRLSLEFRRRYGIAPRDQLIPHITLGYFSDPRAAQRLRPVLGAWQRRLSHELRDCRLTFAQIGLYGFHDMVTFFRREQDCSAVAATPLEPRAASSVA